MTDHDFELELKGSDAPPGEILASDLAGLVAALQELVTRIGRDLDDRAGPGRTPGLLNDLTQLRLRALAKGSTRLQFGRGPIDQLDVDLRVEQLIDERFHAVVEGIGRGDRPEWASTLVAESAGKLVDAMKRAAPSVHMLQDGRPPVSLSTRSLDRTVWDVPATTTQSRELTVVGVLEQVDLRSSRFHVRDDVGNWILLLDVSEARTVGPLVGQRVSASGYPETDQNGHVKAVRGVHIVPLSLPSGWTARAGPSLAEIVDSVPGPDPDGGVELTDEEFASFMASLHE